MSDPKRNEDTLSQESEKKKQKTGYVNWWLFRKKGTVAEPWPTAKELWDDPKVKAAIKNHNASVKKKNGS